MINNLDPQIYDFFVNYLMLTRLWMVMLVEFSVENYRSIGERATLSMEPSMAKSKSYNVIKVEKCPTVTELLKSSAIYGANASGKSNVLKSFFIIKSLVIHSKEMNRGDTFNEYDPFLLDNESAKKPISFEVKFIIDNTVYRYYFSFNNRVILKEELSYYKGKNETFIFKREKKTLTPFVDHDELDGLFKHTGENVLFLSKANNEYEPFGPVFEWFSKTLKFIGTTSNLPPVETVDYMMESEKNRENIVNLLKYADFNISDVKGQNINVQASDVQPEIINFFEMVSKKSVNDGQLFRTELKSIHKRADGSLITTDFHNFESEGTMTFFKISGIWLSALKDHQTVLAIDELDVKLHPDLIMYLLKIFSDPEINLKNSQLIFTTHNTRLLSSDFFRREQIWFTEKNPITQSTELYSLYDYEKRNDRSIEKAYLLGKYGGLPDINYGSL